MKKSVVYLLTGMMMFGLAACGKNADEGQGNSGTNSSSIQSSSGSQENPFDVPSGSGSEDMLPGTDDGWSEEMTGLRAAVTEALGENYWPDMMLDSEMLAAKFGVTKEMYDDFLAEIPMISTNVDTLVVVKAKPDQVDAVETALNAYRDVQINDSLQYPMNIGKVQASMVEKIGDYVLFVQLGADTMDASDKGEEAVIAQCQEANKLVIEAIKNKLGQ